MHSTTKEILDLFSKHGELEYGENFSVNSHSFQAGLLAKEQQLSEELIAAAFLHDIGHLAPLEVPEANFSSMGEFGIDAHDKWGEKYLRERGFSDQVIAPVRNHVASKRYLCAVDSHYHDTLSQASKETMKYQGGPMSEEEVKAFQEDPFFEDSIKIRMIDEGAKILDFHITQEHWDYFGALLDRVIASSGPQNP